MDSQHENHEKPWKLRRMVGFLPGKMSQQHSETDDDQH